MANASMTTPVLEKKNQNAEGVYDNACAGINDLHMWCVFVPGRRMMKVFRSKCRFPRVIFEAGLLLNRNPADQLVVRTDLEP